MHVPESQSVRKPNKAMLQALAFSFAFFQIAAIASARFAEEHALLFGGCAPGQLIPHSAQIPLFRGLGTDPAHGSQGRLCWTPLLNAFSGPHETLPSFQSLG